MNWISLLRFYSVFAIPHHPSWNHLGLQNERLRHAFDALAALIDLPDDGRLFGVTKEVVVMLIQAAETEGGRRFACWEELDAIFESASDQAPSGKSKDPLWGIYGRHPVFAFLMYYHLHFPPGSVMKDKFRHLAPFLVRRMWKCFTQMEEPSADYLYRLGLASQKIVAAASHFSGPPRARFPMPTRLQLASEVLDFRKQGRRVATAEDFSHVKDLLLRNRTGQRISVGGASGEKHDRWLLFKQSPTVVRDFEIFEGDIENEGMIPDGNPVRECSIIHEEPERLQGMIASHEYEVDYLKERTFLLPASWITDPWVAKRKMRGMQESDVMSSTPRPWERRCMPFHMIRSIFSLLDSEEPDPALGCIGLALCCGMDSRRLARILICPAGFDVEDGQKLADQLLKADRYYDPEQKALWFKNPMGREMESGFIPVGEFLSLPLPPFITRHLKVAATGSQLFSQGVMSAEARRLREIGMAGRRGAFLNRLRHVFEGYLVGSGRLPELIADLIQNRKRKTLHSQSHYVTIDWSHACSEWLRMLEVLRAASSASEALKRIRYQPLEPDAPWNSRYAGAPHTPHPEAFRAFMARLLAVFPRRRADLLKADGRVWNAFVAYCYFLMAVTTGRRPQRDPMPSSDNVDAGKSRLFIEDKFNRFFYEARVVPLCPTALKTMTQLLGVCCKRFELCKIRGFSSEVPPRTPFLEDETSRMLVAVSPQEIEALSPVAWEGMRNGPRHLLLTMLFRLGLEQPVIDFISGHRSVQREPESAVSPVEWSLVARILEEAIEKHVVVPLGLEAPLQDE